MKSEGNALVCGFNWRGRVELDVSFLTDLKEEVEHFISVTTIGSPVANLGLQVQVAYEKFGTLCRVETGHSSDYIIYVSIKIKDRDGTMIIEYSLELTHNLERDVFFGRMFEIFVAFVAYRGYLRDFSKCFYDRLKEAFFSERILTSARQKIIFINF